MKITKATLIAAFSSVILSANGMAQTVLIDFGSASTFRGVTSPSHDTNGNHWNSTAFGFIGNLVDTAGSATTIDWAPDGLGGGLIVTTALSTPVIHLHPVSLQRFRA